MVDEIELVRQLGAVEPLPHEVAVRTEAALRSAMALSRAERAAPHGARLWPVDVESGGRQVKSTQRTRRAAVGAAAAAVVIGGAGAGVVLTSHLASPARHAMADRRVPTPLAAMAGTVHAKTAAYVVDHLRTALDANTAVLVTLSHAPNARTGQPMTTETWSSATSRTSRTEVLDATGSPITGYVLTTATRQATVVRINYKNKTWTTTSFPFGSSTSASAAAPLPETPKQVAARLQAAVEQGSVSVMSATTVDGQPALELRQAVAASGTLPAGVLATWVDPTTYLPIREVDTTAGATIATDYRWLPDTLTNRRLLTAAAAIPAGFAQVAG